MVQSIVNKFGRNNDSETGNDIWDGSSAYPFPSAAAATNVISSSLNDALAGTGAQKVTVMGLDTNYNLITEEVDMDGTTQVACTNQFLRVFRAYITQSGSGQVNAGNIDVRHGTTVLARITTGYGQTLMAIYTTPADQYGHIQSFGAGSDGSGAAKMALQTNTEGAGWRTRGLYIMDASGNSRVDLQYRNAIVVPPKTDIRVRAIAGANNLDVTARFSLVQDSRHIRMGAGF